MKRPHAYVISLKFSPVHKTLSFAFGKQLSHVEGTPVCYLLSHAYEWLISGPIESNSFIRYFGYSNSVRSMLIDFVAFLLWRWLALWQLFKDNPPICVYFQNPHPLNPLVALLAKVVNRQCKVIVYIHEVTSYGVQRGFIALYMRLVALVQRMLLRLTDDVVVSSESVKEVLRQVYPGYQKPIHIVPLLFEDFSKQTTESRQYLTYLGRVDDNRGIQIFLDFANYCAAMSFDIKFQIVTRDDVSTYLATLSDEAKERLLVINQPEISDVTIAEALQRSIACMILYKYEIMQSGVPPVAYMNGTPVLVSSVKGLVEDVIPNQTGVIVHSNPRMEDLLEGVKFIRANIETMSGHCRQLFLDKFSEANWSRYYGWLLDQLKGKR